MSEPPPKSPTSVILTRDLFFGSKATGTAAMLGHRMTIVSDPDRLPSDPDPALRAILIDLSLPGLEIEQLLSKLPNENRPRTISFGSHVHTELLNRARDAGCDEVLTKGRFSAELPTLLRSWLENAASESS